MLLTKGSRCRPGFGPSSLSLLYWPSLATLAGDASLGSGPDLAAHAIKAGLVDECHLFLAPVLVGGVKQSFPSTARLKLELVDERRFGTGVVRLRYRTRT